ncbi:SH3 domain-containing protein [Lachnospiraceae bacterium 46-15]
MKDFKEWISDNLRYILLALIVLLIMGAAVLGVSIYSKVVNDKGRQKEPAKQTEIVKVTETAGQTETVKPTEITESVESGQETETKKESSTETSVETQKETEPQTELQTEPPSESETEVQTEPVTEPQPVYLTMQGSCYLRAEPSMEGEIIGEYWTGTTVEFLEDVGGWYKVRVDGMVGYMGARFF